MKSLQKRTARSITLALALLLLVTVGAEAHARYLRSAPGDGAVVASPPARVEIWFAQELFRRQGENSIEVTGPGGHPVHAGVAQIDDADRSHMWVDLQVPLDPGEYRVEYRTLSAEDGDTDDGGFGFLFYPQAAATSTPMLEKSATVRPSETPTQTVEISALTPTPQPAPRACKLSLVPTIPLTLFAILRRRRRP